jgi:hypothetical protein
MKISLAEKLSSRTPGICLYGLAPPKQATPAGQLEGIVAQQLARLGSLPVDGLIVYDIQDETERVSTPRPFPFLPTLNPEVYALLSMKWLGIAFPRWLENELRFATDPLARSVELCERIFAEVWDFAREKGIPLGVNVESVSIRKAEIEASVELLQLLRRRIESSER